MPGQPFRTFVVRTDCRVHFRATDGERYRVLPLKGRSAGKESGCKVFRHYDEDSERLRDGS